MTPLLAHITGAGGLFDGLAHPVTGLDHLAAMALVGALAYVLRDRMAWWVLPAVFVGAMVVGGSAGIAGVPVPAWVEIAIAASVVVLAAALVWSDHLAIGAAVVGIGVIALAHGLAHGGEVPAAASPVLFVIGFVAATAGIHLAGAALGGVATAHRALRALTGAAAAAFGVSLLVG